MKRYFLFFAIGSVFSAGAAFAADSSFSQQPFTDVPSNSPQFESVEYLRTHNVLKGYLDGTFRPTTRINRAEFVKFIVNPFILDTNGMADCVKMNVPDSTKTVFFSDVSREAWYATEVCFAKMNDIINGYLDGRYRPGSSINFVEAAKIIGNVFSFDLKTEESGEFWYRPYVQRLAELRAIPPSIKRFDQILTRGEMAEMVYRLKADRTNKASASFGSIR